MAAGSNSPASGPIQPWSEQPAGAGTSPGVPPPPPSPPARRSRMWAVAVGVVAVVVIVAALALGGVFSPSKSSTPADPTYSQAVAAANGVASGTSGGSWDLVLGAGIMTTSIASENVGSSSGCNITFFQGVTGTLTIPAAPSELTNGQASGWVFLYRNAAETYLAISVLNGQASAIGTIAAKQTCTSIFNYFTVVPSSVIDSSVVASDVAGYAGAFLAAHPDANATFTLIGGASVFGVVNIGPEWAVNYTSCPVNPASGETGASFNAPLNATTGAIIFEHSLSSVKCKSATDLGLFRTIAPLSLPGPASELATVPRRP